MPVTNFQGALRTYLLTDATLVALIGAKIYSIPVPQQTVEPYVVIQKIGKEESLDTLNGKGTIIRERWQLDVYGTDVDNAEAVSKSIYDKLHMKDYETWSSYKIYLSKFENENVFNDPENNGSEKTSNRIQQDFIIKRSYETV